MSEARKCLNCGTYIPLDLRSDAKYCSVQCRIDYNSTLKSKKRRKEKEAPTTPTPKQVKIGDKEDLYFIMKRLDDKLSKVVSLMESQSLLNEKMLTPKQVMSELSIKRTTFDRYVKNGFLKVYKLTDRKLYCKKSEVMTLFKK